MKKKILYVQHDGGLGGAPKSLSYIMKYINKSEYDVDVFNVSEGPANTLFKEAGYETKIIRFSAPFHGSTVSQLPIKQLIKNIVYLIPTIISSYLAIKRVKPDLIHLNSTCLFAFAIAAKMFDNSLPVIFHVREPILEGWKGWALRFFSKRYGDGFIAICKYDLDSVQILDKNVKKEVIYNFVDLTNSKKTKVKSIRTNLKIRETDCVFLYLARFADGNGWKELIRMAEKILPSNENYHFILAGSNSEEDKHFTNHPNIHILQFQRDIDDLLDIADVYICPFIEPHFSRGIIEALAIGIPTLANNIGGVNELVIHEKTGYLYSDFNSFKQYSEKLGNNMIIRKEMGNNGIEFATLMFSLKANLDKTYRFYKKFI